MTIKVFAISLLGIGVVFTFLLMLFVVLRLFGKFFADEGLEQKDVKNKGPKKYGEEEKNGLEKEIDEEEIAVIMTALKDYNDSDFRLENVLIKKRG